MSFIFNIKEFQNINEINKNFKKDDNEKETIFMIKGWVRTVRSSSSSFYFCKINDGSTPIDFQIILNNENFSIEKLDEFSKKTQVGSFLKFSGKMIESPAKGQKWEMIATHFDIIGDVAEGYPFSKGKINLETLRNYYHLRPRTNTFGSIFRIRSKIIFSIHEFLQKEKDFFHVDPNIITINECEGGAGVFQITEKEISNQSKPHNWEEDHFGQKVFLTVSSQLHLEPFCLSLGNVYTMNKSFRSEHSNTTKHASEFTHLEIEMITDKMYDLMKIAKDMIQYISRKLLEESSDDINNLNSFSSPGIRERLEFLSNCDFHTIRYDDAIELINNDLTDKNKTCKNTITQVEKMCNGKMKLVKLGDDLSSIYETYLTTKYGGPVFLTHFPFELKSFYMRRERENKVATQSFDLLLPFGVGELIGGSMREEELTQLEENMTDKKVNTTSLEFYKDLRKYGTAPHGGFGLGVDRLIMLFTGMVNIRDVIPMPVCYKQCKY